MKGRRRADEAMVELGLADDLKKASALIMSGRVIATDPDGHEHKIAKAGEPVHLGVVMRIQGEPRTFVSRAGVKLHGALDRLGVEVKDKVCADIGISTGGFTDVLLRRGARRVHGVDVGYGDVAWSIRTDPRVVLHERTNARTLPAGFFGEPIELAVIDVSFISLEAVLPAVALQLAPGAAVVALVKPQFELPKEHVPGGVVIDAEPRSRAIAGVLGAARALGLMLIAEVPSSLPGRDGNVEHLIHLRYDARTERGPAP